MEQPWHEWALPLVHIDVTNRCPQCETAVRRWAWEMGIDPDLVVWGARRDSGASTAPKGLRAIKLGISARGLSEAAHAREFLPGNARHREAAASRQATFRQAKLSWHRVAMRRYLYGPRRAAEHQPIEPQVVASLPRGSQHDVIPEPARFARKHPLGDLGPSTGCCWARGGCGEAASPLLLSPPPAPAPIRSRSSRKRRST